MSSIKARPTIWRRLGSKLAVGLACLALIASAVLLVARQNEARANVQFPPTGQIVMVEGTPIHAHVEGTGPDLVLIHGASGSTRDFTFDLVARLRNRYRVIVLDRPGLGHSARLGQGHESIFAQARVLQQAAAQLGATRPIVLGHSYGGAVALAWAVESPQTLAALVPLGAASGVWQGGLSGLYQITSHPVLRHISVPLLTAFVPQSYVDASITSVFEPDPVPRGYGAQIGAPLTLRRSTLTANAHQRSTLKSEIAAMVPRYGEISVPVEIVHGQADTIVPIDVHSEKLAQAIPGAHLTRLPGIGHMPHHADPQAVIAAIDRAAQRARLR